MEWPNSSRVIHAISEDKIFQWLFHCSGICFLRRKLKLVMAVVYQIGYEKIALEPLKNIIDRERRKL